MLKCSIFLPFSLEIKTESNTHFVVECHIKMLVCFLMSKLGRHRIIYFHEVLIHRKDFSK